MPIKWNNLLEAALEGGGGGGGGLSVSRNPLIFDLNILYPVNSLLILHPQL